MEIMKGINMADGWYFVERWRSTLFRFQHYTMNYYGMEGHVPLNPKIKKSDRVMYHNNLPSSCCVGDSSTGGSGLRPDTSSSNKYYNNQ